MPIPLNEPRMLGEKMIAVAGFFIVVVAAFCISGLYERDDVIDAFRDAARSVMYIVHKRASGVGGCSSLDVASVVRIVICVFFNI